MKVERKLISGDDFKLPCIIFSPLNSLGAVVIIHGYGGSKEEQLGLAYRIAESNFTVCAIDLRGHGENTSILDKKAVLDVEAAIDFCRKFGKVVAVGHSLGGRLALISNADYSIAISPALGTDFSEERQQVLNDMRSYRVKEESPQKIFEVLKTLPTWKNDNKEKLILYGTRDVPEIVKLCSEIKDEKTKVIEINKALHSDIFTLEITIENVINQLKKWF